MKRCVGTVKDISKDPDGLDVADIVWVWDDKFVENPEDKRPVSLCWWQKIGIN